MSNYDVEMQLRRISGDLAYSVAQTLGEAVSRLEIGDQDWQNEFYLSAEANFENFVSDVLADVGDPPEAE